MEAQFQPNRKEQMPTMPAAVLPEKSGASAGPPAAYLSWDLLPTPREQPWPAQFTNSGRPQPDEKKKTLAEAATPSCEPDQMCRKMIVYHPQEA